MENLHLLLLVLLSLTSFLVFFSANPIHSVLFLILSFAICASILFLFHIDFLAILFIIIYVGAIAILFLFVVMMLNVKNYQSENLAILFLFFFINFLYLMFYYNDINNLFNNLNIDLMYPFFRYSINIDSLYNIEVFGQVFYNYFLSCFLIAGLLLLTSMVGAITLTLNFTSLRKTEILTRQLSRTENFISFF